MNQRRRQVKQNIDSAIITGHYFLQEQALRVILLRQISEGPVLPDSEVLLIATQQAWHAILTLRCTCKESCMKSGEPAGNRLPDGQVSDLVELDAPHVFQQQTSGNPSLGIYAIENWRSQVCTAEDLTVYVGFSARRIEKLRFYLPRRWRQTREAY